MLSTEGDGSRTAPPAGTVSLPCKEEGGGFGMEDHGGHAEDVGRAAALPAAQLPAS